MRGHRSLGAAFVSVCREYLSQGGIHGLRYIVETGNRVTERVMWVIVILLGLIGAGFMVCTLWMNYVDNPIRTSVETIYYPTSRLPFPAVTFCNVNHIFRSKAEAVVSKLVLPKHISPEEAMERLSLLVHLISPKPESKLAFSVDQIREFQMILDNHHYTVRKLMRELGQSCDEMLERCMWEGNVHNCSDLFEERKSFEGFCCSFNYRGVVELKMKDGSKRLVVPDHYKVRHTRYYGRKMGLTVLLQPAVHDYFAANRLSPGIRMTVHGPDDFPEHTAIVKNLPVGREMLIAVKPTSGYCTEAVRALSSRQRKCVFQTEKKLNYFPLYNENNCVAECRMDYTVNYCNCSQFYYHDTGKIRLCDMKDIPCLQHYFCNYEVGFASAAYDDCPKHHPESSLHAQCATLPPCHCPPLCNSVLYSVDGTSGDFQAQQFHITPFLTNNTNVAGRTLLHFYFSKSTSLRTRCDIVHSWHQLVASLGGIFSLFLGCSFMSGIEVLYYFTFRLFVHLHHEQVSHSTSVQDQPSTATQSHRRVVHVVPTATRYFL